jgi:thiol-disulfide isomerase/thioredoxin
MKYKLGILTALMLMTVVLYGQDKGVNITPVKPRIGDNISVIYNPAFKNAQLKDVNEIILYASLVRPNGLTKLSEVKMEKNGNLWQGSFLMGDSLAKVILFRFDSGELTDDNNGNCLSSLVYNEKGNPVGKSHFVMSLLYKYGGMSNGFPVIADKEKAVKEIELENKLYPPEQDHIEYVRKLYKTYQESYSDEKIARQAIDDIVTYCKGNKLEENEALKVVTILRGLKQDAKADEISADYRKKHPTGEFAKEERLNIVCGETDKQKRVDLIRRCMKEIPNMSADERSSLEHALVQALIELKKFNEAYNVISAMKPEDGSMYNSLAWAAIENGENIEKAAGWAKKGVDIFRNADASKKPAGITLKDWKNGNRISLLNVLDTYAAGLTRLGKMEEAERCYDEVFLNAKLMLAEDFHARYVECIVKNNNFEKAVKVAEECLTIGKSSDKLIDSYKTAFLKTKGTEADFAKTMEEVKSRELKKAKEKLAKELINKPAPQFSLKSVDGKTVKLADFAGKVVVVDFWATWCGPCKASFPALQKVYEKYKDNAEIVILAVNTWENEKGIVREKNVNKFIEDNKYTFNVLFDLDDKESAVVTRFGVEGIPTKFIIDKEGNIQFKTVGFNDEKTMLDEIAQQFEMLLKNEHKNFLKK